MKLKQVARPAVKDEEKVSAERKEKTGKFIQTLRRNARRELREARGIETTSDY